MSPFNERESVSSGRPGVLRGRALLLVGILAGVILASHLLLFSLPRLEAPLVLAQGSGGTGVNCDGVEPNLESIPRSPGAEARYVVNFVNRGKELLPEQDGIVFRVDSELNLPEKIKASEIDIHFNTVRVSFGASEYSVSEIMDGNGDSTVEVEVTVTLSADPERQVEIPLNATPKNGATDFRYPVVPSTLTFASGETSKSFVIKVTSVPVEGDGEYIYLEFGSLPDGISLGTNGRARVTITGMATEPVETPQLVSADFGSGTASSVAVTEPSHRGGPATLTIYPEVEADGKSIPIPSGACVQVVIHEDAGLSNPLEGGAFQWEVGTTHDSGNFSVARHPDRAVRNAFRRMEEAIDEHVNESDLTGLLIDWEVELSKHSVRRGEQLEITGRGFAIGTTVIFWRDSNMNGVFDALGAVLCKAESDDNAIATCSIPVTNPPFVPGLGDCSFKLTDDMAEEPMKVGKIDSDYGKSNCNFINARDGQGHSSIVLLEEEGKDGFGEKADLEDAFQVLELAGSVNLGTLFRPYPSVWVELVDFPQGHLESLAIGGIRADLEGLDNRQIPENGRLSFPLVLPGDVLPGRQAIRVTVEENMGACGDSDKGYCQEIQSEVTIDSSLQLDASPSTALPNQRVRITVQGFQGADITRISMDGIEVPASRVGGTVDANIQLDSNGRWVGSVRLPVNGSTLLGGERKLQVRDEQRRLGETIITFPPREIQVTPAQAVPGQTIAVSGAGFPVGSSPGSEFRVEVSYDYGEGQSNTYVSVDAHGRFSTDITVPRAAGVPSSNLVSAEFVDDDGHTIFTRTIHLVTAATVEVSPDHGPPGTTINVTGRGFRPFTPVNRVQMGALDVTPSPAPHTDRNGMVEFEVLVPQSEVGLESIAVQAGGIYVLADFQVGRALVETGPLTPIQELYTRLGDNLEVSFHFGNDTKVWTFYDPLIPEESDLEFLIPGEGYYVQVRESTEVILNGKTRYLSCQEGNCWNLIIW